MFVKVSSGLVNMDHVASIKIGVEDDVSTGYIEFFSEADLLIGGIKIYPGIGVRSSSTDMNHADTRLNSIQEGLRILTSGLYDAISTNQTVYDLEFEARSNCEW